MEWINAREKNPDRPGIYLTYNNGSPNFQIDNFIFDSCGDRYWNNEAVSGFKPEYWMELHEPPKDN